MQSIPWMGRHLAWQVGNGNDIMVGIDPMFGSSNTFHFPDGLRSYLEDLNIISLAQVHNTLPDACQYWYTADELLLAGEWKSIWNRFISHLVLSGIRLTNDPDTLLWDFNKKDGKLTAAKAYECIVKSHCPVPGNRLYTSLWSSSLLRKIGCFTWLVLKNKVLTWDNLQKRGKMGPGICPLCLADEETVLHLFSRCMFWKYLQALLCDQFQYYIPPEYDSIEKLMDYWVNTIPRSSPHFFLPHHTIWAIWKAKEQGNL